MGLLRSETMQEGLLVLPQSEEQAKKILTAIGQETSVQFQDMNAKKMCRPYRKQVQRLEEMERILRYLLEALDKNAVEVVKAPEGVKKFLEAEKRQPYDTNVIQKELKVLEDRWKKLISNNLDLALERDKVVEEIEVVTLANRMQPARQEDAGARVPSEPSTSRAGGGNRVGLDAIAGVITCDEQIRFARAVFRAARGNTFTHFDNIHKELADPKTGKRVHKVIFVILCQGGDRSALKEKIQKVCKSFGANTYSWPQSSEDAQRKCNELQELLGDRNELLRQGERQMKEEFGNLLRVSGEGRSSKVADWQSYCAKEKSIYAVLNMCEEKPARYEAHVWFAATDELQIRKVLDATRDRDAAAYILKTTDAPEGIDSARRKIAKEHRDPPTYIRTNEFTEPWQGIINTYGIPKYQEANPALFTIVTFPFIFGMMYGDVGHGSLLTIAGAILCYKKEDLKRSAPDLAEVVLPIRFLILQLGIFATFSGLLYNDMFSVGLQLFPTRYAQTEDGSYFPTWDYRNEGNGKGGPYPFGVDWAWRGATNELMFMNSMKMKLSVLFGVLQMIMGVFLRFGNAIFFWDTKDLEHHSTGKIDFFSECIPMLIFICSFFGWMDFMIIYKWVIPMDAPPGIINSLICMAIGGEADKYPLWPENSGGVVTNGMSSVGFSRILMRFTMLSVPWLLIVKPIWLKREHDKEKKAEGTKSRGNGKVAVQDEELEEPLLAFATKNKQAKQAKQARYAEAGQGEQEAEKEDDFNMAEIIIHQFINTIEYVLGTLSHAASYLRIWALSLAHQQLSSVFFSKTIGLAFDTSFPMSGIYIYIAFSVWFAITFAVLMGMDVLECFLHTLRLHWVEFDSKFYKAGGHAFTPYVIEDCLSTKEGPFG